MKGWVYLYMLAFPGSGPSVLVLSFPEQGVAAFFSGPCTVASLPFPSPCAQECHGPYACGGSQLNSSNTSPNMYNFCGSVAHHKIHSDLEAALTLPSWSSRFCNLHRENQKGEAASKAFGKHEAAKQQTS